MTHTTNSPSREGGWKEAFDEEFYNTENMRWGMTVYEISTGKTATWREKAHAFIEKTLSSQRDTLVEGLNAIKRECRAAKAADHIEEVDERAFCAGVDAAIKLIKEMR